MGIQNNWVRPRPLCADIVRVAWPDEAGCLCQKIAALDSAISGAACLVTDDQIPVGTTVVIACHSKVFTSKVKHCSEAFVGWLVGVEFEADARWNPEVNLVGHRIDPATAARILSFNNRSTKVPDSGGAVNFSVLRSELSNRPQQLN